MNKILNMIKIPFTFIIVYYFYNSKLNSCKTVIIIIKFSYSVIEKNIKYYTMGCPSIFYLKSELYENSEIGFNIL